MPISSLKHLLPKSALQDAALFLRLRKTEILLVYRREAYGMAQWNMRDRILVCSRISRVGLRVDGADSLESLALT